MHIYIASDHGGLELKNKLRDWMDETFTAFTPVDLGPAQLNPEDDYPQYAFMVGDHVVTDLDSLGILICRSGNGMAIAANKVRKVRAALCFTPLHAQKAVTDDDANILVLDADYNDWQTHTEIVRAFLTSTFDGGRHMRRVKQILEYEEAHMR